MRKEMKKIMLVVLIMLISIVGCSNNKTIPDKTNNGDVQGNGGSSVNSGEITLEKLMRAPESPESDFECVDHGDGDVELLGYNGNSEIVVIPETCNGKKITTISSYVFGVESPVKAIRLSDSISNIMMGAFGQNKNLEIVVCGSGLKTIGEAAFMECSNLHTIVLNDGLETIVGLAFSGCKGLTEVEIPESVTDLQSGAFYNKSDNLKLIGKAGSLTEEYAKNEGITFEAK